MLDTEIPMVGNFTTRARGKESKGNMEKYKKKSKRKYDTENSHKKHI